MLHPEEADGLRASSLSHPSSNSTTQENSMSRTSYLLAASLVGLFVFAAPSFAQEGESHGPHAIVVKLVQRGGSMPFAFEPASVTAQHGDTVRFVEDAGVMHNVHFKTHPSGAKLGSITSGPYLTAKGQTYNVVIDARFTDGTYQFVCDPHDMLGMHGTLTVK
jgi:plastocyanin